MFRQLPPHAGVKGHFHKVRDEGRQRGMTVQGEHTRVRPVFQERGHAAQHPKHAEEVVGVGVGKHGIVYPPHIHTHGVKLVEYTVAPAAIHQQRRTRIASQHKAGVVTAPGAGVARAEHDKTLHGSPPVTPAWRSPFP